MTETPQRDALESGYTLHWYVFESVLGHGGFGITYLARDTNLERHVAIKEFLPSEHALRIDGVSVKPRTESDTERYKWGLDSFMSEARTLAQFDHPNITKITSVFEANDTAYLVMRYEEGKPLNKYMEQHPHLPEDELLAIIIPILDGLKKVHEAGFIHRDIQPGNIFIRDDGSPVLLDFGAARDAQGKRRTMTIIVTPGYAPIEQYYSAASDQGPWTDIYGLGATLYRAVAGVAPMDALERSRGMLGSARDVMVPATVAGQGRYSEHFLAAIDHALMFNSEDRPQSIDQWLMELEDKKNLAMAMTERPDSEAIPTPQAIVTPQPIDAPEPVEIKAEKPNSNMKWGLAFAGIFVVGVGLGMVLLQLGANKAETPQATSTVSMTDTTAVPVSAPENVNNDVATDIGDITQDAEPETETQDMSQELMEQRLARLEQSILEQNRIAEANRQAEVEALQAELKALENQRKEEQDRLAALEAENQKINEDNKQVISEPEPGPESGSETSGSIPSVANQNSQQPDPLQTGLAAITNRDYATALELLRPLADRGDSLAQYHMAMLYWTGRGVLANNNIALDWMRRSARQGQTDAQLELARMYANGINGVEDTFLAYLWYLVTEKNGVYTAITERQAMEADLQPEQIPQAAMLAADILKKQLSVSASEAM
jgi:serine/threonine protein kinase